MRDEMDARLWVAHHSEFTGSMNDGRLALERRLGGTSVARGPAGQILAAFVATGLTLITIGTAIV